MKQAGLRAALLLFVFGMAVGSVFAAESPVDKGSIILGGGGAFSSLGGKLYKDNDDRVTIFLLYPSVGFFPTRGLAVSAQVLLGSLTQGDYSISASGIGPRVTYYFGANKASKTIKGRTYPYVTTSLLFGQIKLDDENDKASGRLLSIGAGLNYMAASSIGVTAEVNYRTDSVKGEDDESDSVSGSSVNIMVGFSLFFWE